MRVYRAEAIERQIGHLRTRQENLDLEIAKKRAGTVGTKAEADALLTTADLMEDEMLAVDLLSSTNSLKKMVILEEAAIEGMLAQILALGSEIEKLESLLLSVNAENRLEDVLRAEMAGEEQSDDV